MWRNQFWAECLVLRWRRGFLCRGAVEAEGWKRGVLRGPQGDWNMGAKAARTQAGPPLRAGCHPLCVRNPELACWRSDMSEKQMLF